MPKPFAGIDVCERPPALVAHGFGSEPVAYFDNLEAAAALLDDGRTWSLLPDAFALGARPRGGTAGAADPARALPGRRRAPPRPRAVGAAPSPRPPPGDATASSTDRPASPEGAAPTAHPTPASAAAASAARASPRRCIRT
jgi:hypothetical protein